jgi:ferredoxin-NADP reductase/ferredoxin
MFKVELLTRDGASIAFTAEPTETVLEAAERADIYLPSSCREGGCGVCKATATSGETRLDECSSEALSDTERAAGGLLLCRAHALSDLTLHAPYDEAAISFTTIPERMAQIVAIEPAGAAAIRLRLQYEEDEWGRAAQFLAGQYVELEIPGTSIRRAYSLANAPNWDGDLEFFIRLHDNGAFSNFIRKDASAGTRLRVRGPQGQFTIDARSLAPRWFVAGGTGLAPTMSMLRQMAEFAETYPCRLFFGVNSEEELFALEALAALGAALPQLETTICVWRPTETWRGFAGTPAEALEKALHDATDAPDIYACGPPPLIEAAQSVALGAGLSSERFFSERFSRA